MNEGDLQEHGAEAALSELLEVASLMVTSFVWSPEALPLAERLAAAVERVAAVTEGRSGGTKRVSETTAGPESPA